MNLDTWLKAFDPQRDAAFRQAIAHNPTAVVDRMAYADWLTENGREEHAAEQMRLVQAIQERPMAIIMGRLRFNGRSVRYAFNALPRDHPDYHAWRYHLEILGWRERRGVPAEVQPYIEANPYVGHQTVNGTDYIWRSTRVTGEP